jgi:hypothetical protein
MCKTLAKLKRNRRVAVAEADGPDGYYIELKQGWSFDPGQDNRVTVAPTVREAQEAVRDAHPYTGPFTG